MYILFACLIMQFHKIKCRLISHWKSCSTPCGHGSSLPERTDSCQHTHSHLSILSDQRQPRDSIPDKHSVIRSVCLDAVLHLWWKHPLALSDIDTLHVWDLALLVVVCRMSLEAREIAIGDFVKDSVLQTLGDCQKKVRLLLHEHTLNIKGMMKW